ncbi:MAG: hypothetical protein QOH87_2976 [Trebonia sp.]|jgi:hypothetical protein|nr:hypothetical protein [Trebonia sp.]
MFLGTHRLTPWLTRWSHSEAGLTPISASPNGQERSNAFAADNSTEWTGGARNLYDAEKPAAVK